MTSRIAAFIVGEGNWLPMAMGAAFVAAGWLAFATRSAATAPRQRILGAMNLFTGVMLLIMGFGHLLAVTVKLMQGTLRGGAGSALLFYVIGLAVVVPAWFVVRHTRAILGSADARSTIRVNGVMALALLVLGLVNIPLALPALCTIGYSVHRRRWVGWAILAVATAAGAFLLIGGLIFMASGQSFEDFSAPQ